MSETKAYVEAGSINKELILAEEYKIGTGIDVYQYIVTEKYDGVRAIFDGTKFVNSQGDTINAPEWFVQALGRLRGFMLDGVLWAGRGNSHAASRTVSRITPDDDEWKKITYVIFDALNSDDKILKHTVYKSATYETRLSVLHWIDAHWFPAFSRHTPYFEIAYRKYHCGEHSLLRLLDSILKKGGEGLMLRKKDSMHPRGRSSDLLKLTKSIIKCENKGDLK